MHEITDMQSLTTKVHQVIGSLDDFSGYFRHVGFVAPEVNE